MTNSAVEDLTALLMHFNRSDWREMHLRSGELEAWLTRSGGRNPMGGRSAPPAARPAEAVESTVVGAPHLGTYRARRQAGERIAKGDVLYDLELLGERTPVTAPQAGVLANVRVKDGELVEFDQAVLELAAG